MSIQIAGLEDSESALFAKLAKRLESVTIANQTKLAYYEAEMRIRHMGIAIPAEIASRVRPVVGWAGTVVDVLEERLDLLSWAADGDKQGLGAIFDDNTLDVDTGFAHLDALLYGTSFVRVSKGGDDEPPVLVLPLSPRNATGLWDTRTRRLQGALTVQDARTTLLDIPGKTITLKRDGDTAPWQVHEVDDHRMPVVPVARLVNRPRSMAMEGRSEISSAVRYYCDAAVRTVLGMEGNREFYSIPQLTLSGRGADAFINADGTPTTGWRLLAGHAIAIDKDEDGDKPDIGQLTASSPKPFLDMLQGWALLTAAEAGFPPSYLGLITDNPPSADAIRAGEARLVKRAERRQTSFGRAWREVAALALMVRDGAYPASLDGLQLRWRDAATPTRAASADEAAKLVGAGVLPPESQVTMDRIGLSPAEQQQVRADRAASPAAGASLLAAALNRQVPNGTDA